MTMRLAVITGASQGLGLETARQLAERGYQLILTGRDKDALARATNGLPSSEGHVLDVGNDASVATFFDWLVETQGRIDVLVNNAGRLYGAHGASLLATATDNLAEALSNNALSAHRVMRRAIPMMAKAGYGRIVNVSSGMGALNNMGPGAVPYRISKTAMNAITILAAHEAPNSVKVNAVCPGWVRTDMGGQSATRDVKSGASGIVWAATLPDDGPTGGFFRDGQPIDW